MTAVGFYARFQKKECPNKSNERGAFLKRSLALFFSVGGVLLLTGISFSIAARLPWLAVLFSVASVFFIGFGFAVKARYRRKQEEGSGNMPGS